MRSVRNFGLAATIYMGFVAGSAHAASISYNLDLSNAMPDGVNYLTVTIMDTTDGDINFAVKVNESNFPVIGSNFGMDNFYFNFDDNLTITADNIEIIQDGSEVKTNKHGKSNNHSGWSVKTDTNAGGGFGLFGFDLKGNGNTRTELLTFNITGIDNDTIWDYATGYQETGGNFFAAHVGGYTYSSGISSAKFSTATSVVPVPASVWLFSSGFLALIRFARRKS
ncbi:MAG: hypothetical protein OEY66_10245 [Gammaproteobacteria bacterium]|nr:hypothetical protein [Gammaproteobacteria bacterium]